MKVPNADFKLVQTDAKLPFADQSFDVCFCSEVLEHVFDVHGTIREICRVLEPKGLLLVTAPYHGWVKNLLIVTLAFERHFDPSGGHIRFFSRRSLTECLRSCGFDVELMVGVGRCWPVWKSMFVAACKHGA